MSLSDNIQFHIDALMAAQGEEIEVLPDLTPTTVTMVPMSVRREQGEEEGLMLSADRLDFLVEIKNYPESEPAYDHKFRRTIGQKVYHYVAAGDSSSEPVYEPFDKVGLAWRIHTVLREITDA